MQNNIKNKLVFQKNESLNDLFGEKLKKIKNEKILSIILNHLSFDSNGIGTVKGLSQNEILYINSLYNRTNNLPLFPTLLEDINIISTDDLKSLRQHINEIINKRSA